MAIGGVPDPDNSGLLTEVKGIVLSRIDSPKCRITFGRNKKGTGKRQRFCYLAKLGGDCFLVREEFERFSITFGRNKKEDAEFSASLFIAVYLCAPRKNNAMVPGPECAPMTGPILFSRISLGWNLLFTCSATYFTSSRLSP